MAEIVDIKWNPNDDIDGGIPTNAKELIKFIDTIIRSAPEEYRDSVEIDFEAKDSYGITYVAMEAYYEVIPNA